MTDLRNLSWQRPDRCPTAGPQRFPPSSCGSGSQVDFQISWTLYWGTRGPLTHYYEAISTSVIDSIQFNLYSSKSQITNMPESVACLEAFQSWKFTLVWFQDVPMPADTVLQYSTRKMLETEFYNNLSRSPPRCSHWRKHALFMHLFWAMNRYLASHMLLKQGLVCLSQNCIEGYLWRKCNQTFWKRNWKWFVFMMVQNFDHYV